MRTFSFFIVALLFGYTSIIPLALAIEPSTEVLSGILKSQGVSDVSALNCSTIDNTTAERYGEAYFTEMIDVSSPEYQAILKDFPAEKRAEIFRGMGLQNLGCVTGSAVPAMAQDTSTENERTAPVARLVTPSQPRAFNLSSMGFVATWTTLVWMFSALGFAVFMVWITSSKFRFQFRKMAEGEFDMNDKAMTILKERFARGEVTKEQFDKMRRDILN